MQPADGLSRKKADKDPKPGDFVQEAHGTLAAGRLDYCYWSGER